MLNKTRLIVLLVVLLFVAACATLLSSTREVTCNAPSTMNGATMSQCPNTTTSIEPTRIRSTTRLRSGGVDRAISRAVVNMFDHPSRVDTKL